MSVINLILRGNVKRDWEIEFVKVEESGIMYIGIARYPRKLYGFNICVHNYSFNYKINSILCYGYCKLKYIDGVFLKRLPYT